MIPLDFRRVSEEEQRQSAERLWKQLSTRRSVRQFSPEPVPLELIENAIRCAGTAPSGANKQPWTFVVVRDAGVKREIREAAEAEEMQNYERRFPHEWLEDLEPFGTDWHKEFLEVAPFLIVIFAQDYQLVGEKKQKHYFVQESVGIAAGFLLAALHLSGLATLTHTPSPMKFLSRILGRPKNERPFLLIPVGYPAQNAKVPDITKKPLAGVMIVK